MAPKIMGRRQFMQKMKEIHTDRMNTIKEEFNEERITYENQIDGLRDQNSIIVHRLQQAKNKLADFL